MLKANLLIKKLFCLFISFILLSVFIIWSNQQDFFNKHFKNENRFEYERQGQFTDEDFIIESDNTFVELGGLYENIRTDEDIILTRPADDKHSYDLISYENFIVTVVFTSKSEIMNYIIGSITLTSEEFSTHRGIKVGDSLSDVFDKYGEIVSDSSSYRYCYKDKFIIFYTDNNKIVKSIELDIL